MAAKTAFEWKIFVSRNSESYSKLYALLAEMRVFERSMAIVIGPTPPGTGVMAEATLQASS